MLWKLFVIFFKINLFTASGPASYGLTEKLVVPGIVSLNKFQEIMAVSANIPGSDAIQMAWQIGYHAANVKGAIVATLGALTPCIFLVSIVMVGLNFIPKAVIDKFFGGMKPILFLFLCITAVNLFIPRGSVDSRSVIILFLGGILLYFRIPIILIMCLAGLVSVIF